MKTKQIITVCLLAAFLAGFGLWSVLRTPYPALPGVL